LTLENRYTTTSFKNSHPTTDVQFDYAKYGINTSGVENLKDDFVVTGKKYCNSTKTTLSWTPIDGALCYVPYVRLFKENASTSVIYTLNGLANVEGVNKIKNVKSFYTNKDTLSFTVEIPTDSFFTEQKIYGYEFYVVATMPDYTKYKTDSFTNSAIVKYSSHNLTTTTTSTGSADDCTLVTTTRSKCNNPDCSYDKTTVVKAEHQWDDGIVTKEPTCTDSGSEFYTCTVCGTVKTETISPKGHKQKSIVTKATTSKNGKIVYTCTVCGKTTKSATTIYYPKKITLSTTTYTYDGKVKKPSVKVVDSNGKTISSSNYTVTYPSGRKNVGTYKVTIKFKGTNYSGTVTKSFKINPKNTSISSVTAKSKGFTVKIKKYTTQTTGYQIQYSTDKNFKKNNKTVTVKNSTTSKTISKLSSKKKYYVRIRTYKTVGKTKYYSSWSKSKSITTKK
jgi:hypothetical protein